MTLSAFTQKGAPLIEIAGLQDLVRQYDKKRWRYGVGLPSIRAATLNVIEGLGKVLSLTEYRPESGRCPSYRFSREAWNELSGLLLENAARIATHAESHITLAISLTGGAIWICTWHTPRWPVAFGGGRDDRPRSEVQCCYRGLQLLTLMYPLILAIHNLEQGKALSSQRRVILRSVGAIIGFVFETWGVPNCPEPEEVFLRPLAQRLGKRSKLRGRSRSHKK